MVDEHPGAWQSNEPAAPHYNERLIAGSCVLETLALVGDAEMRYVFVDDFGQAVRYCRWRLFTDLVEPAQPHDHTTPKQWRQARAALARERLAHEWLAADAALTEALDAFTREGYTAALGERLRQIVNRYGYDLELGAIYALPDDLAALLAVTGNPFVWWDDDVNSVEDERQPFDYASERPRAVLTRRLLEAQGWG